MSEENITQHRARLEEIATIKLGELSDEEALRVLAERKQLEELEKQYQEAQKEQARLSEAQKEEETLKASLEVLNKKITPDKPDDELLGLIKERKDLEAKIETVQAEIASLKKGGEVATHKKATAEKEEKKPAPSEEKKEESQEKKKEDEAPEEPHIEDVPKKEVSLSAKENVVASGPTVVTGKSQPMSGLKASDEFGGEGITSVELPEMSDLRQYIDRMKNNLSALGTILDELPASAKKNKAFMLEVAKIDPAYAMHYADTALLKKDEDFNVRVAGMKNERNSGNALAEMLPEARTSKVVLAAVKQDYKNVRFAVANMEDYEKILEVAKKGALENVKKLKDSVDVSLLVPKILQKDKDFMEQVQQVVGKEKE